MGIRQFAISQTEYELDYIPQKLRTLELCVLACSSILNEKYAPGTEDLTIGGQIVKGDALRLLRDLAIDAGLISNRLLLNFVEIKLDSGGLINQKTGVSLSDFGLGPVPVAVATQALRSLGVPADALRKIWVHVLTTASKALAHFTDQGASVRVEHLGFGSYATSLIVRSHFFDALGKAQPPSLLGPDATPRLDGHWLGIEPPVIL